MPEQINSVVPQEAPSYPVINEAPTAGAVIANFGLYDFGRMGLWSGIGAVWGFAGGAPRPSHRRRPRRWG